MWEVCPPQPVKLICGILACDASAPMIVESGCALEPAAHALGDVIFSTTPAEVSIVVTHEGTRVGAGSRGAVNIGRWT